MGSRGGGVLGVVEYRGGRGPGDGGLGVADLGSRGDWLGF